MPQQLIRNPEKPWLGGNIRGGDRNTYCPAIWDYLIKTFCPSSICDIGCGEGYLLDYFRKKNILITGIDGLPQNQITGPIPVRQKIIVHDFRNALGPLLNYYDMVISCEFVEHVEEEYSVNFLEQFKLCKTVVFTHALPDQIGYNHVNCQKDHYWINIMESLEFHYLPIETNIARKLAGPYIPEEEIDTSISAGGYYWNTVLIFQKNVK